MSTPSFGRQVVRAICLIIGLGVQSSQLTSQVTIGKDGIRVPGEGGQGSSSNGCLSAASGPSITGPATRLQATSPQNQRLLREEQEWQQRLKVSAEIYVISADNAFAEPGRVLVGQQLANRYMVRGADYALQALAYVAAHEFGHELQFRFNTDLPSGPTTELQADAIAGYWAGMRLAEQVGQGLPPQQAQAIMSLEKDAAYAIGDYVFSSPQHHGTPNQRREAVRQGLIAGYSLRYGANFRSDINGERLLQGTQGIVAGILQ